MLYLILGNILFRAGAFLPSVVQLSVKLKAILTFYLLHDQTGYFSTTFWISFSSSAYGILPRNANLATESVCTGAHGLYIMVTCLVRCALVRSQYALHFLCHEFRKRSVKFNCIAICCTFSKCFFKRVFLNELQQSWQLSKGLDR